MITKYSSAPEQYSALFDEATKRLQELGVSRIVINDNGEEISESYNYEAGKKIDSLEEYFSNLRNLVYGPQENELDPNDPEDFEKIKAGYKFLKLPVNEEYFEINANTREIKVPDHFGHYGVSVLGDEVAEILFFRVDRFYDATDLSQTDIAFYWSHSSDPNHTIYSTPAFFSIVESDPINNDDKLIFGWPISSEITKQAGKISFSVRFFIKDPNVSTAEDEYSLIYSLSTSPNTISINNGLTYDIKGISIDNRLDDILGRRLINSPFGKKDPPTKPVIIFANSFNEDLTQTYGFKIDEGVSDERILAVLGYKIDNGSLTYTWYHKDINNKEESISNSISPLLEGMYVPVEKFIPKIARYFYKDITGSFESITVGNEKEFEENKINHGILYARCATYTLTADNVKAGRYYAKPTNTLYNVSITNEDDPEYVWIVAGADQPEILSLSWGLEKIIGLTDLLNLSIKEGKNITESTEYNWSADFNTKTIIDTDIDGASLQFTSIGSGEEYLVEKEGYYKVEVSNMKNHDIKTDESNIVLVLKPVADFTVSVTKDDNVLTANLSRELEDFETVTYAWHKTGSDERLGDKAFYDTQDIEGKYYVTVEISKGEFNSRTTDAFAAS